ncbi:hypothetical protein CDES_01110 [Corynebacterium deserti GIMN1.010]|uniref:Uncharacterized protein n=1 Tax=Corynebacterium deserti GIMN1.010 TaxID=931089 RepID=A0A0M4CE05_9CORY|nr:hypothetical protein [Corynebacterium deserti]ALC04702.1 hypothetical protein CDES_01110 [Corynebacterium deserti GIMN1.010]
MNPQTHPVISVLDNTQEETVLWHVQTDPASPAGLPTGAWILNPNTQRESLDGLLRDTVVLLTDGSTAPKGANLVTIEGMREGVDKRVAEYNQHGVRLTGLAARGEQAQFRGEPQAEAAWRAAMELVEVVKGWHEIESARRSRKVLAEAFGAEVQPLPLDTN